MDVRNKNNIDIHVENILLYNNMIWSLYIKDKQKFLIIEN